MAKKEIPRELSIWINDKQVINSLTGITSAISKTKNEMGALNKNSETYQEDLEKLGGELKELTKRQNEFKEEIKETSGAMDDASGSFSKFRDGLLSGDLKSAKEGLLGIKSELKNIVKTSLEFIAQPLGASIAVLGGIGLAAKEWFNYNESIVESTRLIENLTGKTGEAVAQIRVNIQALSETFDVEFNDLANAVDNLMDTGVAKSELEALEKIKNGLLTAPDKNEFISSLESSALTAKQVGLTLEEVIALKKEIENNGVDPEASFGALQKAAKNLTQQTATLKQQMRDALGAGFADDILAKVKSGEITITQALISIGEKAREMGLNQKQQMDLTISLLGKQGMAAGGLLVVTKELTDAQNQQTEALTPLQQATKDLADSQLELQKSQDAFLRSDGFEIWKTTVLTALNSVKKGFFDYANEFINGPNAKITQISNEVIAKAQQDFEDRNTKIFEDYITKRQKAVGENFSFEVEKENYLADLRAQYSKVSGWDANEAQVLKQKQLEAQIDFIKKYNGDIKKISTAATEDEIRDAKEAAEKIAKAKKEADDKKRAADEKAAKEELDRAVALAKAKGDLAKAELNFFIAMNKSKLDSTKALTPDIISEETNRLDQIKDKELDALVEKRLADVEKAQADAKSAEEFALLKLTIDYQYETDRQNLELGFQASTDAMKKQYAEEQKVLKAEQLQADNELALAEADSKFEEDRIKQQQDYQKQLADYKKLLDDKKITQDEYARFLAASKKHQQELDDERENQQIQSTLGGLNTLANALGEMFGQSKELALAQASISGAQAILSIWTAPAALPQPYDAILKGVLTAASVLQTGAQIKNINKQKAPKKPKFFYGGHTGSTAHYGFDEYGPMTGMVHDDEYVIPKAMTQSPRYANTIAWLEQERTGRTTKKFADGGGTSPNAIPDPVMNENTTEMTALLRAVLYRLENPIAPDLLIGYEDAKKIKDLNDERDASDQNGIVSQ